MCRFLLLCVFNLAYSAAQNIFQISNNYDYTYLGLSASSYSEARRTCERYNSELLIIHNKWELNTLNQLLTTYRNYLLHFNGVWLNAFRSRVYEGCFEWGDGTYVRRDVVTWATNEPSNENNMEDCLVYLNSGHWRTMVCQDVTKAGFICQKRSEPTTPLAIQDPTTKATTKTTTAKATTAKATTAKATTAKTSVPTTTTATAMASTITNATTFANATIGIHSVKAEPCNIVIGMAILTILCVAVIICLAVVVHISRSKSKDRGYQSQGELNSQINRGAVVGGPCTYSYAGSRTESQPAPVLGYTGMQPIPECARTVLNNSITDEYVHPVPCQASSEDDYTDVARSTTIQKKTSSAVNQNLQGPISYINLRSDSV